MHYTFEQVLLGLFAVVNNIAAISPFIAICDGLNKKQRLKLAKVASIASMLIMVASMFIALPLLNVLDISMPAFRIAGGIVLSITGLSMLNSSPKKSSDSSDLTFVQKIALAIVPIAIPMTAGPGSISTIAIFAQDLRSQGQSLWVLFFAIIAMSLIIYLMFKYSTRLSIFLGETGMNVLIKVSGLFTLAIGVQFILSGISSFVLSVIK